MSWDWRADLETNSLKRGRFGACRAFVFDPSFTFVVWVRLFMFLKSKKALFCGTLASFVYAHIIKTFSCEVTFDTKFIGKALKTPHPLGIVIGGNTEIADNVTIHQNVTFGRKNFESECQIRVGSNAIISAGAAILGPVSIGEKAIVGANAVVLSDVMPHTTVVGIPARAINRTYKDKQYSYGRETNAEALSKLAG